MFKRLVSVICLMMVLTGISACGEAQQGKNESHHDFAKQQTGTPAVDIINVGKTHGADAVQDERGIGTGSAQNEKTSGAANDGRTAELMQQIRYVFMIPPIPSQVEQQPLFPERDGEKIGQLLAWLDAAKPVPDDGLTAPLHGRSMAVDIVMMDGNSVFVRPAWHCVIETAESGNAGTSCKPVIGKIWVSGWKGDAYFAESEQLYAFVSETYKDWMPDVAPFIVPEQVRLGEMFQVSGSGWLSEKVIVTIAKNGKTVAEAVATPMWGHFEASLSLADKSLAPGDYELSLKGEPFAGSYVGGNSFGITLKVTD